MAKQLIERTVQNVALEYMVDYYKWRAKRGRIWNKIEVRTKKGKRADGLLAFRKRVVGGTFVASMEAKSFKTLHNIKPRLDPMLWAKNSAYYGSVATFVLAIGILFKNIDEPRYALMLVINSWVILTVLIAIFTRKMHFNQTMDVFKQVLLYKADEQWISLSKDSFEMIDARLQKPFIQVLKARGIGLLIVNSRKKVNRIHKPKRNKKLFGNFLKYYSVGEEIKKYLNS
jgi:hypothetical protein